MAQWFVAYCPSLDWAHNDPTAQIELPRYRVCSVDEPDRWIVETNSDLPREVQEDCALLIAEGLSRLLGV